MRKLYLTEDCINKKRSNLVVAVSIAPIEQLYFFLLCSLLKIHSQIYIYNIYKIMETIYPLNYHHNGFFATHLFEHMIYGYALVIPMNQRLSNK